MWFMRSILIRFDDICPTMNWQQWERAHELLDKYNIKPLIGVIPDCKDPDLAIEKSYDDFWKYIKELQKKGFTIAMHGYQHVFTSNRRGILTTRKASEFAGHTLEEQIEKIRKGKDIFKKHGIETDVFFAPAHSYDENTIKALSACGFKYVSDGKSSRAYKWHGIKFLPCRNSGSSFREGEKYSTSIFHVHEWTKENKNDYNKLEYLCAQKTESIVDFEMYKKQPLGTTFIQRLIEHIYVWLQFSINPYRKKIFSRE